MVASPSGLPTNCAAIGNPAAVNATGTVRVGLPDMSNGAV
jgi:hypothetical protein